jgi:hypothetical protein
MLISTVTTFSCLDPKMTHGTTLGMKILAELPKIHDIAIRVQEGFQKKKKQEISNPK